MLGETIQNANNGPKGPSSSTTSKRSPSPFNHLPDSLALTLKVLKRYKREGRELTAEEAEILSGIADAVKDFQIEDREGDQGATAAKKPSPRTTSPQATNAISSRLNAALTHAQKSGSTASLSPPNSPPMTAASNAPLGITAPPTAAVPFVNASASVNASGANITLNNPHGVVTAAAHSSTTPTGAGGGGGGSGSSGNEAFRVRDLINKLRRAADSGEVFKELMVKSATVDSLVEFAVQCNKASNNRTALANVIVNGVKALAGRNANVSRPVSASATSVHGAVAGAESSGSAFLSPRAAVGAGQSPRTQHTSVPAANPAAAKFYGRKNVRVFILNKNDEVLEDPLTGEMIGGVGACIQTANGSMMSNNAGHNNQNNNGKSSNNNNNGFGPSTIGNAMSSFHSMNGGPLPLGTSSANANNVLGALNTSTVISDANISSAAGGANTPTPKGGGGANTSVNSSHCAATTHGVTTLGQMHHHAHAAGGGGAVFASSSSHDSSSAVATASGNTAAALLPQPTPSYTLTSPKRVALKPPNNSNNNADNNGGVNLMADENAVDAKNKMEALGEDFMMTEEDSAAIGLIIAAITDCFANGRSNENVERDGNLYLPLTVDGECLGVLAIFEFRSTIDASNKMHIVAASQSIAALSVRNVGLLEDVGWQMNKANAMLQMANQLAFDNLDERTLSQSIIVTAKQLIDADRCSIFVVKGNTLQAYFEDGKTVIISNQSGIAGHVARTGETVNIVEAYDDHRFNPSVDKATGYRTKTILCMPIRFGDQIVGVAQLINKNPLTVNSELRENDTDAPFIARWQVERPFSSRDEELFATFSTFVGVSLRNCRINQGLQNETEKSTAILDVVAMLSQTDIRDVNNIASHVMAGAKRLLHADRSTLFLVDKENHELYSEIADNNTTGSELRVAFGSGIAGKVASSQRAENIVDAYKHPDFDPSIDKALGYSTYSMLCEPIIYHNEVLAVAQLMNKIDVGGPDGQNNENAHATLADGTVATTPRPAFTSFTEKDQETFRTFAMFAGISISNAHMLRFAVDAGNELSALNARIEGHNDALSMESSMMSADVPQPTMEKSLNPSLKRRFSELGKRRVASGERQAILDALAILNASTDIDVTSPSFDLFLLRSRAENPSDMGCAVVLKVFQQTGFLELFQVDTEVFLNFICQCRRLYRKVPYHNFFHVVDACQTIYTFLFRGGIRELLSDWECFTLLITAIVHDLDHMGVNNSFHLKTDSPLGILSSATGNTSVLEVHHCNLAIDILIDPTSNVFSGMDDKLRSTAVKALIECILATDMARHAEFLKKFEAVTANAPIGAEGGLDINDEAHRKLVMDLVMKAADISNVTKPFELSRLWAVAVTEEFYRQGDQEKAKGVEVLPMFDRSKKNELAKGQIGFINFVAEKFFTAMCAENAFPGMRWALDNLLKNKQEWTEILNGTTRRPSLIDLSTPPPDPAAGSPRQQSFSTDNNGNLQVPK